MSEPRRETVETPRLSALLARVGRRLVALACMHGIGTALAGVALWLSFAYLADRFLHLPAPIRVLHLAVLVGLPLAILWRELWRPLRRMPDERGRAVLVERAHPELEELLVSAIDLGRRPSGAPELVAALRQEADRRAAALDPRGVLAPSHPRRRLLIGLLFAASCFALLVGDPSSARVFLARLAGGPTPWPQRTHLALEVPGAGELFQLEAGPEGLVVRVARGTDLPLVVRAHGVVPDEVTLHFSGGARSVLAASGGGLFRTLLRSCQEDQTLWATGGDDRDREPRLSIVVLDPPEVVGVAVRVAPPAYSGLAESILRTGDVEVLAGSALVVHVLTDPPEARGEVRLLPRDETLALTPRPFPAPQDAPGAEGGPPLAGLAVELEARESLRYRFELVDDTGLKNPDPGLFSLQVTEDRPPRVELVAPGRGEVETTPGGALALRAIVRDDFGLASLELLAGPPGIDAEGEPWLRRALALRPLPERAPGASAPSPPARAEAFAGERLELAALSGAEPPQPGQTIELVLEATDVREPEPGRARSPVVRVRVVTVDELLRRVQDRLARVRASAAELLDLQLAKQRATFDLLAALESDALESGDAAALGAALTGQRRVAGDARSLLREVAGVTELVLYARIDERAGGLLEALDAGLAEVAERGFQPEPWRRLVEARSAAPPGAGGLASKLVDILGTSLEVGEELAPGAAEALARAQDARELTDVHGALERAGELQRATVARIESLLELLAEWDDFQSVLSLTRDLLNRQKTLAERTKQYAKEN
jgi:hypothetical protein